jgi:hypothetical protein
MAATMTEEYPLQNLSLSKDFPATPEHFANPESHNEVSHGSAEGLSFDAGGSLLNGNGSFLAPVDRGFGAYSFVGRVSSRSYAIFMVF